MSIKKKRYFNSLAKKINSITFVRMKIPIKNLNIFDLDTLVVPIQTFNAYVKSTEFLYQTWMSEPDSSK